MEMKASKRWEEKNKKKKEEKNKALGSKVKKWKKYFSRAMVYVLEKKGKKGEESCVKIK